MARSPSLRLAPAPTQVFGAPLSTVSWFVLFLVAVDVYATHQLLLTQLGTELNPAMNWLWHEGGPRAFAALKVGLTALCLLWVNLRAPAQHARLATLVAMTIYLPIVGLHAVNTQIIWG